MTAGALSYAGAVVAWGMRAEDRTDAMRVLQRFRPQRELVPRLEE
jgi:hypothetical protein